jgi:hypothetical protein
MPQPPHHPNPSATTSCFKCGGIDNWARDCQGDGMQSNLINLDEEGINNEYVYKPKDSVEELKTHINTITAKEKGRLANEMGVEEDFPMA